MLAKKQRDEIGLAQEIAEQRRGVTVGVVKVPVTVIERWEEMAKQLEGSSSALDHRTDHNPQGETSDDQNGQTEPK